MEHQFFMHFDTMPKATAQQKGVSFQGGKPRFYTKSKVRAARDQFLYELIPHKPKKPSEMPIRLSVILYFDVKDKSKWGKVKPTRPDTENYLKLLKDCMIGLYFKDDSQVVDEHTKKYYSEKATIYISWEEVEE